MHIQGRASAGLPHGWSLTAWLAFGVIAASLGLLVLSATPVDGARMIIRLTARTSLVLFTLAFTASSLAALLPSPCTIWLRDNRRYLGVAFAFSHLVHAAGIVALSRLDPALFDELTTPVTFIAGGLGYAIILAMVATSFDRTAAMLGPRAWRVVHKGGAWILAIFFVVNFGRRAVVMPGVYWPYVALILAAIAVRLVAGHRRLQVGRGVNQP